MSSRNAALRECASEALAGAASEEVASVVSETAIRHTVYSLGGAAGSERINAAREDALNLLVRMGEHSVDSLKGWLYLKPDQGSSSAVHHSRSFSAACRALATIRTTRALEALVSRLEELGKGDVPGTSDMLAALQRFEPRDLAPYAHMIRAKYELQGGASWQPQFLELIHSVAPVTEQSLCELRRVFETAVKCADAYRPYEFDEYERARREARLFEPGKHVAKLLANAGSEDDIVRIATIAMTYIADGYVWSGIREAAERAIRATTRPLAQFYASLWDSRVDQARALLQAHPDLQSAVCKLSRTEVDVEESPKMLLDTVRAANVVLAREGQ